MPEMPHDPDHCTTCGKPRGEAALRRWYHLMDVVQVDHLPQRLCVNLNVWRDGSDGQRTHLCDDCLRVGLRALRERIDQLLSD